MREILFRGKRIDNDEWVEGSLISNDHGRCFIAIHPSLAFGPTRKDEINGETLWGFYPFFEVDPSTVGQYTGLTDKNGKKIFDGDICKFIYYHPVIHKVIIDISNVFFDKGAFCSDGIYNDEPQTLNEWLFNERDFEVIGNIHDNPELLEDKE